MSKLAHVALIAALVILLPLTATSAPVADPPFQIQWNHKFSWQEHIEQRPLGYPICLVRNQDRIGEEPDIQCYGTRECSQIRHLSWGVNGPRNTEGSYRDYEGDGVLEMGCYVEPYPHHVCGPQQIVRNHPDVNQHRYIRLLFAYRNSFVLRYDNGAAAATFYFERDGQSVGDDDVALLGTWLYTFWQPGTSFLVEAFGRSSVNPHPICNGYLTPCIGTVCESRQSNNKEEK